MTEINHENNQYEQEPLATPRSSDLSHDRNIQRNKNRLAASIVLGITGVVAIFMAAETLTDPNTEVPPIIALIGESAVAVASIGLAVPLGIESLNNLKAYNE